MNNKAISYQPIELDSWSRKNHFNFYKNFKDPCFNICLTIDVQPVLTYVKQKNIPISSTLLFLSSKAINKTRAFKIRIDNQQRPYVIDTVHPSATILHKDETFTFCNFSYVNDMSQFLTQAKKQIANTLTLEPLSAVDNQANQVFYSIIPWLHFTGYKHARGSDEFTDIPKIVFGKILKQDNRAVMPISVELHHALADAIDVAKYIDEFQALINTLK